MPTADKLVPAIPINQQLTNDKDGQRDAAD